MAPLVPCLACHRHVRVDSVACPFCGKTLENAESRVVPAATRRLDRLAFFTFATTFAVAACSTGGGGLVDNGPDGGTAHDGAAQDGTVKDDGGVQALYGAAYDAAGLDTGPNDDGGMQAAYGIPVDSGGAQPPYGLPPQDAGGGG